MIISTTESIEGRTIASYLGVVSGDAVMGTNLFRDMFAGLRDLVGGRSGAYEKELKRANSWRSRRWPRRRRSWGRMR